MSTLGEVGGAVAHDARHAVPGGSSCAHASASGRGAGRERRRGKGQAAGQGGRGRREPRALSAGEVCQAWLEAHGSCVEGLRRGVAAAGWAVACALMEGATHVGGSMGGRARACEPLRDFAWEQLHTGHWCDVPELWRDLYALASCLQVACEGHASVESQCRRDALVRHMRALDMAAMMGGPGTRGLVQAMAAAVHAALADQAGDAEDEDAGGDGLPRAKRPRVGGDATVAAAATVGVAAAVAAESGSGRGSGVRRRAEGEAGAGEAGAAPPAKRPRQLWDDGTCHDEDVPPGSLAGVGQPVPTLERPSLQSFWQSHMSVEGGRPALLTGCMDHWPAMSAWPDPGHLLRVAGFRTVPVELGSSYLAPEWTQRLMTVGEFVRDFMRPGGTGNATPGAEGHGQSAAVAGMRAAATAHANEWAGSSACSPPRHWRDTPAGNVHTNRRLRRHSHSPSHTSTSAPHPPPTDSASATPHSSAPVHLAAPCVDPVSRPQHRLSCGVGEVGERLAGSMTELRGALSPAQPPSPPASLPGPLTGYLAQHPLLDQIPELRRDVAVPDYCCLGKGEMRGINAWFGPRGTVTPLHTDPHHNLLCQVVGSKYVRLYHPSHSHHLYPRGDSLHSNASRVSLDRPDHGRFPLFTDAPFAECLLRPGQMLYIPPGWWHYVRSLSASMSVSFWWE